MKKDDFERLKAICEKEGFKIEVDHPKCDTFNITKKDPWDGVEFVTLVKCAHGFVYKVIEQKNNEICIIANGNQWFNKCMFVSSTEEAYVEQLKKEALERFGDIRDGDKFKNIKGSIVTIENCWGEFEYVKDRDLLCFGGVYIYHQGKWATRVKERVKVGFVWREDRILGEIMPVVAFHDEKSYDENYTVISLLDGKKPEEIAKVFNFLASQLEKYLNNEIE